MKYSTWKSWIPIVMIFSPIRRKVFGKLKSSKLAIEKLLVLYSTHIDDDYDIYLWLIWCFSSNLFDCDSVSLLWVYWPVVRVSYKYWKKKEKAPEIARCAYSIAVELVQSSNTIFLPFFYLQMGSHVLKSSPLSSSSKTIIFNPTITLTITKLLHPPKPAPTSLFRTHFRALPPRPISSVIPAIGVGGSLFQSKRSFRGGVVVAMAAPGSVQKSEEEWRAVLSSEQFRILRQKGTE